LSLTARTAIWLVLATGVRAGELTGGAWAYAKAEAAKLQKIVDEKNETEGSGTIHLGFIDLNARVWHLTSSKNQRDHAIYLSDFAINVLRELRSEREKLEGVTHIRCPWVFPNADHSGPVGVKTFGKQIADRQKPAEKRLRNRSKKSDELALSGGRWTTHDLRRTAATIMARLSYPADVIDECLNHKIAGRATRVYVRDRRIHQQKDAFDSLGLFLTQLTEIGAPCSQDSTPGARVA
jgi:integrase